MWWQRITFFYGLIFRPRGKQWKRFRVRGGFWRKFSSFSLYSLRTKQQKKTLSNNFSISSPKKKLWCTLNYTQNEIYIHERQRKTFSLSDILNLITFFFFLFLYLRMCAQRALHTLHWWGNKNFSFFSPFFFSTEFLPSDYFSINTISFSVLFLFTSIKSRKKPPKILISFYSSNFRNNFPIPFMRKIFLVFTPWAVREIPLKLYKHRHTQPREQQQLFAVVVRTRMKRE